MTAKYQLSCGSHLMSSHFIGLIRFKSLYIPASLAKKSIIFLRVFSLKVTGPCCPPGTEINSSKRPCALRASEKRYFDNWEPQCPLHHE